jgi:hypothetical protein
MPSLPASTSPIVPPDAPAQTVTIDGLGRLFAAPEARAAARVTIARRGKPAGLAPRDMAYEWGGLTWRLKKGEGMPVIERQEVHGLCFRGALVAVYYEGARVYDIVRVGGAFEVQAESLATWLDVPGDAEVIVKWQD